MGLFVFRSTLRAQVMPFVVPNAKCRFLVFSYLFILVIGKDDGTFRMMGDLHERWLRATSMPEVAMVLKHPPYSYHSLSRATQLDFTSLNASLSTQMSRDKSCGDDLLQIASNFKTDWALQMLDSDGKLESGLLRGGILWPGHFDECVSTYAPPDGSGHGDFHGQYCVTSWNMNVSEKYSNLPLTVGVCVPDSCSEAYLKNIGENMLKILERFPILEEHSSLLTLKSVTCKLKEKSVDTSSIIYLTFVVLFMSLTVVGTVMVLFYNHGKSQRGSVAAYIVNERVATGSGDFEVNSKGQSQLAGAFSEKETDQTVLTPDAESGATAEKKLDLMQSFWKCFSVIENGKKILSTKSSGDQLLSIHGIRFLSLTWVILGHTYITSISIIGNRKDVLSEMDTFAFQVLLQSPFSVDSFFLLSGFLLSYLFLKEADKRSGKINWLYFYIHRIWRLTPAYMIVVFFYILVFKYLGSGPFWDDHHCDAQRDSWWKYLLYVNNFIPINQMCVGWSWYLANDMQFYIISPLFLYPLWRWPAVGFSLLSAILIGTWTTTAVLSYYYDLIPMFVGVTHTKDFTAYAAKMWESFDLIYDKPYCRIAPYIIGVGLGYLLCRMNSRKKILNWWQQLLGWTVASFCGLSVVFGLYRVEMSRTTALFYNSLCRSSFSIGLAWLIFVCETGHGGFLSKFLSWKLWIPLSRLTYSSYLIHPIFIHVYYQSYQSAFFFTEFIAVTSFLGFVVMSYTAAFFFSLTFESPLMNLEKLALRAKEK